MILFVTSCDRAFSESERLFLEKIEQWNKKVVVVLSKVDILDNEGEVEQVKAFVEANFKKALGVEPVIFTISSKQALKAKEGDADQGAHLQHLNRFVDLEKYILTTLDPQTRAKIKLENPVNVGKRLITQYKTALEDRIQLLKGDVKFLDGIQAEIQLFKEDMKKGTVADHIIRIHPVPSCLPLFLSKRSICFSCTRSHTLMHSNILTHTLRTRNTLIRTHTSTSTSTKQAHQASTLSTHLALAHMHTEHTC